MAETNFWDRPIPPKIWRWLLFKRATVTLWAIPLLAGVSFVFNGKVDEFFAGAMMCVGVQWVMACLRRLTTK